ncbi:MAG: hypothetical protein HRT43_08860 [Campylobacteraceae bacterium]|nr:hypothetical protein [Campylobacteraceae bacterium]
MKRYDLRPLKDNFYERMFDLIASDLKENESGIFLFEIGDFTPIQKVADFVRDKDFTLMNSLKFNEVDWTVVIKKASDPDNVAIENSEESNIETASE